MSSKPCLTRYSTLTMRPVRHCHNRKRMDTLELVMDQGHLDERIGIKDLVVVDEALQIAASKRR